MFLAALLKAYAKPADGNEPAAEEPSEQIAIEKEQAEKGLRDALASLDFTTEWPSFKPGTPIDGAQRSASAANPARSRWV